MNRQCPNRFLKPMKSGLSQLLVSILLIDDGLTTSLMKLFSHDLDSRLRLKKLAKVYISIPKPGFFLNLFLLDIIHRPEFEGTLRIFPELELSITETNGAKKRKLYGRTDYTIGFGQGKDIMYKTIPPEVHLVAVEAKADISAQDMSQCIAEAATLYKTRVDAGKAKKSIWGILSNAETWKFIFIDENGLLWKSGAFDMDLHSYNDAEVLKVYRIVHHIVKRCHEACTPPP